MTPSRRSVLAASALGLGAATMARAGAPIGNAARFSLKFAPHEGSFASRGGLIGQIAYAADQGFTAWEDNEAVSRPIAQQEEMANALRQRNMTMGVLVASMPKWSQFRPILGADDGAEREAMLSDLNAALEAAKRLDAKWLTVVTGFMDPKVPLDLQTARVIELMRRAGDIAARAGRVIMTPHHGEMSSLANAEIAEVAAGPQRFARRIAGEFRAVVALKGRHTIVAAPDGTCAMFSGGNKGLATSGSGDVLAGVIGGGLATFTHLGLTGARTVSAPANIASGGMLGAGWNFGEISLALVLAALGYLCLHVNWIIGVIVLAIVFAAMTLLAVLVVKAWRKLTRLRTV